MMRIAFIFLVFLFSCSKKTMPVVIATVEDNIEYLQKAEVQLASPKIFIDSLLFQEAATVNMSFDVEGSKMMYSVGDEAMKEYHNPIKIDRSSLLQAKVKKEGYIDSAVSQLQLIKVSNLVKDAKVKVSPLASDVYPASGPSSLIDLQKGSLNFRDGNKWLGFQSKRVEVDIVFPAPKEVSKIYVSLLSDPGAWIFKPQSITVFIDGVVDSTFDLSNTRESEKASLYTAPIMLNEKKECKEIKVIILSLDEIPSWHQGKGTSPWLFVDEIIVQ